MYGYIDSNGNKHLLGFIPVTEADEINFDNSNTDLQSTDVQGAIEELTSAENIAYDSNNSVKQKIDEYNISANTKVNLSSYTSSNPYTFPSNGYLLYENNGSTLGRGYISNLLRVGDQFGTDFTKTSGNALYVKKGMTFYVETAFYKVEFYPLQ